jgi:hypothetical protein
VSKVVNVALTDDDHLKMVYLCAREGKTISGILRNLIRRAYAQGVQAQECAQKRLRVTERKDDDRRADG